MYRGVEKYKQAIIYEGAIQFPINIQCVNVELLSCKDSLQSESF